MSEFVKDMHFGLSPLAKEADVWVETPSKEEIDEFFGVSGENWTPTSWSVLVESMRVGSGGQAKSGIYSL